MKLNLSISLIIAPVSVLLNESKDEKTKEMLQSVQDSAMKINSLIRMSLNYYNDNSFGSENEVKANLELVAFARQIFLTFEESFPNLGFTFYSSQEKMPLLMDVIKMESILTNIISNACKYTPDGGSIILSLSLDNRSNRLSIRISDTGVGIPSDELPLIFQRYYQSSRTKKDKQGTGIGLNIVKKYVDLLDGEISVSSEGEGTTFQIILPVENAGEEDARQDAQTIGTGGKGQNIVIVDDNVATCNFLSKILGEKYQCLCAHDGVTGLKLCRDVIPDLIISDVIMPDMDGLEMCRRIREYSELSIVPIILQDLDRNFSF